MDLPALLPAGDVEHRRDPNADRWACVLCGILSKRARKEADRRCLRCFEESHAP